MTPRVRRSLKPVIAGTAGLVHAAELSQLAAAAARGDERAQKDLFPIGKLRDRDLQQVDLRGRNSWRLLLAEVIPRSELLEVQLVNASRH